MICVQCCKIVNNLRDKMVPKRWRSRKKGFVIGLLILTGCFILVVRHNEQVAAQQRQAQIILSALGSRNTTEFVKPDENTILVDGTLLMKKIVATRLKKQPPPPFVLIMVLSQIGFEEERRVVRDTWYNWAAPLNTQIVFFLGLPPDKNCTLPSRIQDEIKQFKDIVVDDFVEHYYLLTVKVIRMLKWFVKTYPNGEMQPTFLVKTDHDVFNNLPNLIQYLKSVVKVKDFVGGLVFPSAPVIRDGDNKWYTPEQLWSPSTFPPYAAGPCYIMSGSIVSAVYKASLKIPLFHLEDVFITGFVAKMSLHLPLYGLRPRQIINSNFNLAKYDWDFRNAIAYHTSSQHDMKKYYYRTIHNT